MRGRRWQGRMGEVKTSVKAESEVHCAGVNQEERNPIVLVKPNGGSELSMDRTLCKDKERRNDCNKDGRQ